MFGQNCCKILVIGMKSLKRLNIEKYDKQKILLSMTKKDLVNFKVCLVNLCQIYSTYMYSQHLPTLNQIKIDDLLAGFGELTHHLEHNLNCLSKVLLNAKESRTSKIQALRAKIRQQKVKV